MKSILITAIVALLLGLGLGSQLFPKTKIEQVETERVMTVKDVVTVIKVITRPDGTTETTSTTTDKTKEAKAASTTLKVAKTDWHAAVAVSTDSIKADNLVYSLSAERRLIGDLYVGGLVSSDKRIGVSVGLDF